jgi:response regulator RpfG family c-di-GMP phosphodiesterase
MSSKVFFERVDLLLVLAKSQNGASLRESLCEMDFRNIRNAESISDVLKAMEARPPDILISDYDLPDGTICDVIRDIRHHKIGINPFMSIVVTTWNPSEALVREVADCGADDLLIQPASRKQLAQRVEMLTYKRKPFVVTSKYIGPDRRIGPRPGKQVITPKIVPNVLLARVLGKDESRKMQKEINLAIEEVNFDKLVRNAAHIGYMVQQVLISLRQGDPDEEVRIMLNRLIMTAEETIHRLSTTNFGPVSKLCASLIEVAHRIHDQLDDASNRDLKLLPALAMSIRLALKNVDQSANAAAEISLAISGPEKFAADAPP